MTLPLSSLIAPAQSGVTPGSTATPATGTWLSTLMSTAQTLGLNTASWPANGVARQLFGIAASALAQEDALVSTIAQAGYRGERGCDPDATLDYGAGCLK